MKRLRRLPSSYCDGNRFVDPAGFGEGKVEDVNSRERILAAFNHEPVDKVPIFDLVRNTGIVEHYTGNELTYDNGHELVPKAISCFLDGTRAVTTRRAPGKFETEEGFVWEVHEWTEWVVKRPFTTVEELKSWVEANIERWEATSFSESDIRAFKENEKAYRKQFGETQVMSVAADEGLNYAHVTVGIELFSLLMADYPELVQKWINTICDAEIRKIHALGDPDICPFGFIYSDIAYKNALMFSPSYLSGSGYFERINKICNAFHDVGMKAIYHSDGYIMDILPQLVEAGVDGINPIEISAGMDVYKIFDEFGDRITVVGGVDSTHLLVEGSPEDVRGEVRRMIEARRGKGGLIIGSSTELGDDIPVENILAMAETVHECS